MMAALTHAIQVTGAQVLLYVLVPAWALARIPWRDAGEFMFATLVAGVSSAALLGWACNGSGIGAGAATAMGLTAWIGAGFLAHRKKRGVAPLSWNGILMAVLLLAWTVRIIHPLHTWALGQSDAYSHLGFLMDVLERGRVDNPGYPPAYAWVQAFPSWILRNHPYWMARFGGAFFGAGLALGAYALLARIRSRVAGYAAAALVAGCPAFFLLQKTGVGCFANQLGLLLVPATLWAYASGRRGWLAAILAALSVSVPMMLLHVSLLLGILTVFDRDAGRGRLVLLGILALAFALALAAAMQWPPERGRAVASMLTGQYALTGPAGSGWHGVWRTLAADFFSIKRFGYGSGILNAAAMAATAAFAWAMIGGGRNHDTAWRMVGAWGLLTSANVHLGLFQFTNYQREGWSMLLASAGMGALIFDAWWRKGEHGIVRKLLGTGLAAASLAGLVIPPAHVLSAGPAESDVVRCLLSLDSGVTVLARPMSGFDSGQGDIVRTLHPKAISNAAEVAAAPEPVYFLRDRPAAPRVSPVMKRLQPALSSNNERARERAESDNRRLERQLSGFEIRKINYSPYLEVWQILPGQ